MFTMHETSPPHQATLHVWTPTYLHSLRQALGRLSRHPRRPAEPGVVSASLRSLTCSTCPVFSSSHSSFDWVECQRLPAQNPEQQSRSSCPGGMQLPEPGRGVCQPARAIRKVTLEWPGASDHPTPQWCSGVPWPESAHGTSFQPSLLALRILDIWGILGLPQTRRMSGAWKRQQLKELKSDSGLLPFPLAFASASLKPRNLEHAWNNAFQLKKYEGTSAWK